MAIDLSWYLGLIWVFSLFEKKMQMDPIWWIVLIGVHFLCFHALTIVVQKRYQLQNDETLSFLLSSVHCIIAIWIVSFVVLFRDAEDSASVLVYYTTVGIGYFSADLFLMFTSAQFRPSLNDTAVVRRGKWMSLIGFGLHHVVVIGMASLYFFSDKILQSCGTMATRLLACECANPFINCNYFIKTYANRQSESFRRLRLVNRVVMIGVVVYTRIYGILIVMAQLRVCLDLFVCSWWASQILLSVLWILNVGWLFIMCRGFVSKSVAS